MQEINTKKLHELIEKLNKLNFYDDIKHSHICEELLYYCGNDEKSIIDFLTTLNLDDLVTMSEIFEEISIKLGKSKTFKASLENITSNFPDVNFSLEYC